MEDVNQEERDYYMTCTKEELVDMIIEMQEDFSFQLDREMEDRYNCDEGD